MGAAGPPAGGATGRATCGPAAVRPPASLLTPGAASVRRSRPPAPRLDVASRRRHGRGTRCCRAERAAAGQGPRRVWGLGAGLGRAHRGSLRGGRDRRAPSRLPTSRGIRSLQVISVFLRDAGAVTLAGGAGIPPRTLVRACAVPAHPPPIPAPGFPLGSSPSLAGGQVNRLGEWKCPSIPESGDQVWDSQGGWGRLLGGGLVRRKIFRIKNSWDLGEKRT